MDMKVFYQKLRQVVSEIPEPHVVIVSSETEDGGKAGVMTEVTREVAARMIIEGLARLALGQESTQFQAAKVEALQAAEKAAAAARVQFTVVAENELRALRNALKPSKG